MTNGPDTDVSDDSSAAAAAVAPTAAARLLALQEVDTEADQLVHRRENLPEREQVAAASGALSTWESERSSLRTRMDELAQRIEEAEREAAEIAEHKTRLEAQMKTVIAPREAEALMHEIATLDERTDELDMSELEALEEQSDLDDRLTDHLGEESDLRDALGSADSVLEHATSEIDAELARLAERRAERRAELDESLLTRYDRVRGSSGVAVATLSGHRCTGCHLDLSAAEVDDVKDEANAADGVAECPNCGRILGLS
jgi:predicted  nucleic acid-binding Zn-ribbon protein